MIKNLVKKVRLIVTVIVTLLIISGILSIFGFSGTRMEGKDLLGAIVAIIILCMLLYVIIYYWYGKDYKCPSCNKRFCLKKESKEVVGKEAVSVLVQTNTRNRNGEVTGSQEQYVPGERITYRINYVCRKCGEKCQRMFTEDVPKV